MGVDDVLNVLDAKDDVIDVDGVLDMDNVLDVLEDVYILGV